MDHAEIEIVIIIDADGEYEIGKDRDQATEFYEEQIGGNNTRHEVTLKLKVPLPKAIKVSGELPRKDDGTYSLEIHS